MLTLRGTPATSTRASELAGATTSTIWPGMARHTLPPLGSEVRLSPGRPALVPERRGISPYGGPPQPLSARGGFRREWHSQDRPTGARGHHRTGHRPRTRPPVRRRRRRALGSRPPAARRPPREPCA